MDATTSSLLTFCWGGLLLALTGCGLETTRQNEPSFDTSASSSAAFPRPVVAGLQQQVQGDIEKHVGAQQASTLKALSTATTFPAAFKRPIVVQSLTDPWKGLVALEGYGHRITTLARSGRVHLPALIETMEAGMDRAPESVTVPPIPTGDTEEEHLVYIRNVLEEAHRLRAKALRRLSLDDQRFLFEHASPLVENFFPHFPGLNEQTLAQAQADLRSLRLVNEQLDYSALIASAQVLARLADDAWLNRLAEVFRRITGEVVLTVESPHGLIVIGGPGPNTYDWDGQFAVVIDLGGDDTYRGTIAASADVEHGISVVIDLAGNDTYHPSPLGLATGRLGVGLLIDRAGDDVYHLSPGSGGTGFAGIGMLVDVTGNDRYVGSRFTQGVAVGGLGLLLDEAGDDTYTSFGFAIGFGGPSGVGAVVDVAGDDRYQCGEEYPSVYNPTDASGGKPGDPLFQYDCFGMGFGSGKRIFNQDPAQLSYGLAGGWGMLLDLDGNDRYHSSNFSQGAGYFFGAGMKLDFAGYDEHHAARYGHAAGAHFGVGLFIDYQGRDRYGSSGPFYNGGAAWDRSVTLFIDAGQDDDVYDLQRSSGLGRADHHAWSVFIEEGGRDRYLVPNGMGTASNNGMSGFFDLAGEDEYVLTPPVGADRPGNGRTLLDQAGSIFMDR